MVAKKVAKVMVVAKVEKEIRTPSIEIEMEIKLLLEEGETLLKLKN